MSDSLKTKVILEKKENLLRRVKHLAKILDETDFPEAIILAEIGLFYRRACAYYGEKKVKEAIQNWDKLQREVPSIEFDPYCFGGDGGVGCSELALPGEIFCADCIVLRSC